MANKSPVYSNARVRVMENTFLNQEKFNRLVYSESVDEALRVLAESNYGGGAIAENGDYEKILRAEEGKVSAFMAESMPEKCGMESFLMKQDYHNAKALTKAKYMRLDDAGFMLAPQGTIDIDLLKDCVNSDSYSRLPALMAEALSEIDVARANGDKSPRTIDVTLDKACFRDVLKAAKEGRQKTIIRYWTACIDFANVTAFIRYRREGEELRSFRKAFAEGGEISLSMFESVFEATDEAVAEKFRYTSYGKTVYEAFSGEKDALVAFERAQDNYLLDIFKRDRTDIFSISPLAGFYVAKKQEIKVVRMILICIKNHVDTAQIKARLRDYYA